MGNRCVITTASDRSNNFGVYLHWNGGRDSVEAFLAYCKLKEYRSPDIDCYGWARLCQVIGNFFGGDTSIGFDLSNRLDCDNYDNGVFLIQDWEIVGRQYQRRGEQMEHDFKEMLHEINEQQPQQEQLERHVIDAFCEKRLQQIHTAPEQPEHNKNAPSKSKKSKTHDVR
ncbi:hypothetical protein LJC34_06080 [Oscillospiraceae bacterium OttesenSCG-928-G22]|nr:hypothetical protein [Oscillospiraceae bacterium OttesenSCG-928-G22]